MNLVAENIESLIIMALDATCDNSGITRCTRRDKKNHMVMDTLDQGSILPIKPIYPESSFTVDMTGDRVYTMDHKELLQPIYTILGEKTEVMMLYEGGLKWSGYKRMKQVPKRMYAMGRVEHWYEIHFRTVKFSGKNTYSKRVVPLDTNGLPVRAKFQDMELGDYFDFENMVLACSVIEDAKRANSMLATVSDAKEIKFPVGLDAYQEVFALRNGPLLPGGRRKSIIHWVSKHIRKNASGKESEVKEHQRGISEFDFDGIKLKLEPNERLHIL